ncbi:VOC family protein [Haladaptatus sp. YSMS36]|uniref:VOC family protein n=1 Tax=Haladaptatus sp. YSMS36 TaxID=3033384 RepID=UPI0023E8B4CA|nr:VOC family protein [Haladaptatus sp. YSMS36]
MNHPTLVGHVHLKVRDLSRAHNFYTEVLALGETERHQNYVFLSWGERHHDVALQEVGPHAAGPGEGVGMFHAAFEVDSVEAMQDIYRRLVVREVDVTALDHGISKALYFDDPDGNGLEVYLDTRDANDQRTWDGYNGRFDPLAL